MEGSSINYVPRKEGGDCHFLQNLSNSNIFLFRGGGGGVRRVMSQVQLQIKIHLSEEKRERHIIYGHFLNWCIYELKWEKHWHWISLTDQVECFSDNFWSTCDRESTIDILEKKSGNPVSRECIGMILLGLAINNEPQYKQKPLFLIIGIGC